MKYEIPIIYLKIKTISVEADNLQEAIETSLKEFLAIPEDGYLSINDIDTIIEDNYPDEEYSVEEAFENI